MMFVTAQLLCRGDLCEQRAALGRKLEALEAADTSKSELEAK